MNSRTRLAPGDSAPAFRRTDHTGATVSLATHRGQWVWLAFFRYVACPLCNLRLHEIRERRDELRPLEVLAVFQSTPDSVARFAGHLSDIITTVCDPDESLYGAYGVESSLVGTLDPTNLLPLARAVGRGLGGWKMEGTKTRVPADFIIDPHGVIRDAFYGRRVQDHIPIERPLAVAERVRAPTRT